jgi:hypothetical protein
MLRRSVRVSNSYAFPYKYRLRLQERSQWLSNEAAICRALATFRNQYPGNQRRHVPHPHQEGCDQESHENDSHEPDYTFISIDLSKVFDVGTGMQGNILSVYKCATFSDLFRYSHSNLLKSILVLSRIIYLPLGRHIRLPLPTTQITKSSAFTKMSPGLTVAQLLERNK